MPRVSLPPRNEQFPFSQELMEGNVKALSTVNVVAV
jgi:hypothetical protein